MKSLLLKGGVLLFFLAAIAAFVLYRNGTLDEYIYTKGAQKQSGTKGDTIAPITPMDTSALRDHVDSIKNKWKQQAALSKAKKMSSSKSIVLTEGLHLDDSIIKMLAKDTVNGEHFRASSSKSMLILDTGLLFKPVNFFDKNIQKRKKINSCSSSKFY